MTTETFDITGLTDATADANGRVEAQCWPTNPPVADPVSSGTLRLWQYGRSPQFRAEIFQSTHTLLTQVDDTLPYTLDDKSITLYSGTAYNGFLMEAEAVPQTSFVVFKYSGVQHLVALLGNATSVVADEGYELSIQNPNYNSMRFLSRGIASNDTITFAAGALGSYLVAGVSHTSTSRQCIVLNCGTASRTGVAYAGAARQVAAGNGFFSTSYSFGQIISASAQVGMAMTQAQLKSTCEWLAKIEKNRGVPVYG